ALELLAEALLGRLGHLLAEDREYRVARQRAQPFERLAHRGPLLVGAAGLGKRAPDLLEEELGEAARDRARGALDLLEHGDERLGRHAQLAQLLGRAQQRRAR